MSDSPNPTAAAPRSADRASFGQALRPIITMAIVLAVITAAQWAMLRYVQPFISVLLVFALAIATTIGSIAIVVSTGDGIPHQDHRAQDLTGLALIIAIIGPSVALCTLLFIMG
ncbi:MAG: hypothetical protein WD768_13830 [Phycisphaeraceae bacterium]